MSQQVTVERELVFKGNADHTDNVEGNICCEKHVYFNDFDAVAVNKTNDIASNESYGGSAALNAQDNGALRVTTGASDNDKGEIATGLYWYARNNCVIEARVKVDNIAAVGINVGFSDVAAEADDQVAFEIAAATITDRCTDGVCWVFDTDATTDVWYMCNTKDGTQAGTSYGVAPVAATYEVFRIALNSDGDATFYRNGEAVGHKASAVTTTVALTPYVAVISRAAGARNLDIDYIKCWQDRY